MVRLAAPDLVESAALFAATVTLAGLGTALGAVNSPVVEILPAAVLPPTTLFTLQVTFVLVELVTVAVNCKVPEGCNLPVVGTTAIAIALVTVTAADADLDVSASLVAATVTFAGFGITAGAV
jgi:hypothetical protein